MKKFTLIFLLGLLCSKANAALIASDYTLVTVSGQTYSQSFSVLNGSSFSDIFIDITIKGDYTESTREYFEFFIDGVSLAKWSAATPGLTVINNSGQIDYTIMGTINLSGAQWDSFVLDSLLDVSWVNGPGVDASPTIAGDDFVQFSVFGLASNVVSAPEPSLLILLALFLVFVRLRNLA